MIFLCLAVGIIVVWLANVPSRCEWCGLVFEGFDPSMLYVFSLVFGMFVMVVVTFYTVAVFLKERTLSSRHLLSFLIFVSFLVFMFIFTIYSFYIFGPLVFRKDFFVQDNRSRVTVFSNRSVFNWSNISFSVRHAGGIVFDYSRIFSVVLIVLFVLFYLSYDKSKERRVERRSNHIKRVRRPVKSYSEGLLDRVALMDVDDRGFIILVYSMVYDLLVRSGVPDNKCLTAREFEDRAKSFLPLELQECFHILTYIFEEAKYSNHQIHKDAKDTALETLYRIQVFYGTIA